MKKCQVKYNLNTLQEKSLAYKKLASVKLSIVPCALLTDNFLYVEKIAKRIIILLSCYNTSFAYDVKEIIILR